MIMTIRMYNIKTFARDLIFLYNKWDNTKKTVYNFENFSFCELFTCK